MPQLLLEGEVDNRDSVIDQLREENETLRGQVIELRAKVSLAERTNKAAVSKLRHQLEPLYRALQQVFGEIEVIAPAGGSAVLADSKVGAVWESWKSRLGQTTAKVIEALLTHGDLGTQQLAIITGLHRTTIPQAIYKLNKAGLINKNGGKFSLKQLG